MVAFCPLQTMAGKAEGGCCPTEWCRSRNSRCLRQIVQGSYWSTSSADCAYLRDDGPKTRIELIELATKKDDSETVLCRATQTTYTFEITERV